MPDSKTMSGSCGDRRPPGHEAAGALMLPDDGPDEAQQLPRDRGADFVFRHPAPTQPSIASTQSFLYLLGDGLNGGCGLFGASLQGGRLADRKSIAPGRFHQHPPHMGVTRALVRAPRFGREPLQRLVQPLDPTLGFLYRVHGFLKDDLLDRMIEALGLQPAKRGLRPATAPGVNPAVALQEAVEPLAHATPGATVPCRAA